MLQTYDIPIAVDVSEKHLEWPEPHELEADYGLGGNRSFCYLGQSLWSDCKETLEWEGKFVKELQSAEIDEVLEDEENYEQITELSGGLDPGVASAVLCLAASGTVPFSSCNGGVFGDHHHEQYPLICFYCRPYHVPFIESAARASSVGLERKAGYIVAYAGDVRCFLQFAHELYNARRKIDKAGAKVGHRLATENE